MLQEMKHLFKEHLGEEMKDPKLKERAEVREKHILNFLLLSCFATLLKLHFGVYILL